MKIAIVVGRIEHKTGIARSALEIGKYLSENNDVTIVGPVDPRTIKSFSKKIKYQQIGYKEYNRAKTLMGGSRQEIINNKKQAMIIQKHFIAVDHFLRGAGFDIVDNWGNWATFQNIATCRFCLSAYEKIENKINPKSKFVIKNDLAKKKVLNIEKRRFEAKKTDIIIANSKKVLKEIKTLYKVQNKETHVLYNGIDTQRFCLKERKNLRSKLRTKFNISPNTKIFLFICTNSKRKNLKLVLETFINWQGKNDIELWILGEDKKNLPSTLPKYIRIFKKNPKPELYYAASDIVLIPTIYDACCNVVLEASGMGLPILVSDQAGSHELFSRKEIIIHKSVISAAEYRKLILKQLEHFNEFKLMGLKAAKKIRKRPWKKVALELELVYQQLIKSGHAKILR